MLKWKLPLVAALAILSLPAAAAAGKPVILQDAEQDEPASLDLFEMEAAYVGDGEFRNGRWGSQDSWESFITYSHRFHLTGNWYLRAGFEYLRFDFGSSVAPVPTTLQGLAGIVSVEYVYRNHVGAALELYPGAYFEQDINRNNFDMPFNLYTSFRITEKLFGVVGVTGAMYREYQLFPIVGVIWLINDDWRLQAVINRPALIFTPNEDWEFRLTGDFTGGGFRRDSNVENDPRLNESVIQYADLRAGLRATYKGFRPFAVSLTAGYSITREFNYVRVGRDIEVEPAPYVSLGIVAQF